MSWIVDVFFILINWKHIIILKDNITLSNQILSNQILILISKKTNINIINEGGANNVTNIEVTPIHGYEAMMKQMVKATGVRASSISSLIRMDSFLNILIPGMIINDVMITQNPPIDQNQ